MTKKKTRQKQRQRRRTSNPYGGMMRNVTDMGKFAVGASVVGFTVAKVSDALK